MLLCHVVAGLSRQQMLQELTGAEGHYPEEAGVALYTLLWDHLILPGSAPLAGVVCLRILCIPDGCGEGWAAGSYCFVYTIPGSTWCQLHWSRCFPALIYSPGVGSNKSHTLWCPQGQRSICQVNKIPLPTVLVDEGEDDQESKGRFQVLRGWETKGWSRRHHLWPQPRCQSSGCNPVKKVHSSPCAICNTSSEEFKNLHSRRRHMVWM